MKLKSLFEWNNITTDWHQVLLVKLGLKKDDIVLRMRNGLTLKLINRGEHSDTVTISEMYLMKPYVQGDFAIKDNWTIIDMGANVGIFSTYATKAANNVKVFAYEPSKENFSYLQTNISNNNLFDNIKPFKLAVTSKAGQKLTLYLHSLGSGGNSLYKNRVTECTATETIKTTTLEEIIETNNIKQIDLLKMDVEGAEYDILLNLSKSVLSRIKRIVLEVHPDKVYSIKDLEDFFRVNGFCTYINCKGAFCIDRKGVVSSK